MRPRRAGDGWPNGNRDEVQRLARTIGAAGRAPSSSSLSGAVTPGRSGAATPMSGEASWRSSPLATALTPSTRMGRAVHRGEVKCRTMMPDVLLSARTPSPWSSSSSRARACGRCARLSSARPWRREARSWIGLRRLNRGVSRFREASVRRRCEAPRRTRCRSCGWERCGADCRSLRQQCRHNRGRACTACRASRLKAKPSPAMRASLTRLTTSARRPSRARCSPVRTLVLAAGRSGART